MGGVGIGADSDELMMPEDLRAAAARAPLGGGGSGNGFSFQAGVFPLPGLSFGWSWPPTATPRLVDENGGGQRILMRDPHAVNRPPTREEWLRAVVQQVFLAVFFAMFGQSSSASYKGPCSFTVVRTTS